MCGCAGVRGCVWGARVGVRVRVRVRVRLDLRTLASRAYISPISRPYISSISFISPPYIAHISPISPAHLARVALRLARLVEEVEGDLGRGLGVRS